MRTAICPSRSTSPRWSRGSARWRAGPIRPCRRWSRQGDLVVDTARRRASRGARQLDLAPAEFGVLELLLTSRGRAVSAQELLERVWDEAPTRSPTP
ncbi:winged helix-turn-helix domain-containing protein [Streptomyces sp. NRRL S-448]|uniref:winged helix-turn-helix domain-containing protein n=1 Tax=Streptomyces sp. NRRL S-448 TaxID=1463907 RepID=UPI003564492D